MGNGSEGGVSLLLCIMVFVETHDGHVFISHKN